MSSTPVRACLPMVFAAPLRSPLHATPAPVAPSAAPVGARTAATRAREGDARRRDFAFRSGERLAERRGHRAALSA